MTWSARITRPDGTTPITTHKESNVPDYQACQSCMHCLNNHATGNPQRPTVTPCNLPKIASTIGSLLTSIDCGADGHMAGGEAILRCHGYENRFPE